MKKLIAVLLSVLILLPVMLVPSFAAEDDIILSGDALDAAVVAAASEFIDAPDGAKILTKQQINCIMNKPTSDLLLAGAFSSAAAAALLLS